MPGKYYSGGSKKSSSAPSGSLTARGQAASQAAKAQQAGGQVPIIPSQPSSLQGSTGNTTPTRTQVREAILSKPTATQQLGKPATTIAYQTVKGVTQTNIQVKQYQPVIGLSPGFAGRVAAVVPGGVNVVKAPMVTYGAETKSFGDTIYVSPARVRSQGSAVGTAVLPYSQAPKVLGKQEVPFPQLSPEQIVEMKKKEEERRRAFGLPPTTQLGTTPSVKTVETSLDKFKKNLFKFGMIPSLKTPDKKTPEFLKPAEKVVSATLGGFAGGFVGMTPSEQREYDKVVEESERLRKARLVSTLVGTGVGLLVAGVPQKAVSVGGRVLKAGASYGERALVRLGLREAEQVVAKQVVKEAVPIIERVVSREAVVVGERAIPKVTERVVERVVSAGEVGTPRVARVVEGLGGGVPPIIPSVQKLNLPARTLLSRALSNAFIATPQALAEGLVVTKVALPQYVEAVKSKYSAEDVKIAQELLREQQSLRGFKSEQVQYDEQGRATNVGFFKEVKTAGTFKGLAQAAGRTFEYSFVSNLPLGQQATRWSSYALNKIGLGGEYARNEEELIRREGVKKGLSGTQLDDYVKKIRKISTLIQAGEAGATLAGVERTTERLGLKTIGSAFAAREGLTLARKEVALKVFSIVAPKFVVAGAIEGGLQYETQLTTRGGERTLKGELVSIGGGALISTVLGGGSVSFAATRPGLSKTLGFIGQAIEAPYEYLGDKIAAGQVSVVRRLGGEVVEPAIKPLFSKTVLKVVKSPSASAAENYLLLVEGKTLKGGVRGRVSVPSFGSGTHQQQFPTGLGGGTSSQVGTVSQAGITSQAGTTASVVQAQQQMIESLTGVRGKGRVGVKTTSPIQTAEQQKTKEEQTVKEEQKTKQDQQEQTKQEQKQKENVNATVESLSNVNIPIDTNVFGLRGMIPPVPLPFPMGGEGGGGRSSKKLFANELLASQSLFKQQIGFGLGNLSRPVGKGKTGKPGKVKGKQSTMEQARSLLSKQLSFGFGNVLARKKK